MDVEQQARSRSSGPGTASATVVSRDEKDLNATFKWMQIIFRFLAVLYEVAALAFLGYVYDTWKRDPSVRVDVVFPSFFPVTASAIVDIYEIMSLLLLERKWPINPFVIVFDVVVVGVSIFCFLILGMTDYEGNQRTFAHGSTRSVWATDMNNGMIFMIVFWYVPRHVESWIFSQKIADWLADGILDSLLHAMFVLLSVAGLVYRRHHRHKEYKKHIIARSRAEMVQFEEMQKRQAEIAAAREIVSWTGQRGRGSDVPTKGPLDQAQDEKEETGRGLFFDLVSSVPTRQRARA
ncbi:hypothetical protein V8F33_002662 [Rhypophila sp. PSN 637]